MDEHVLNNWAMDRTTLLLNSTLPTVVDARHGLPAHGGAVAGTYAEVY